VPGINFGNETAALTVEIAAAAVSETAGGGATTVTVRRNTPTAGALLVSLTSSDAGEATVPASVTIADGADWASFPLAAVDDLVADGPQTVTITASAAGLASGSDTLEVTDNETAALTVEIAAAAVSETAGGGATTVTVRRNTPTAGALLVSLTSSDAGEATVPASVTIADGADWASFPLAAVDDLVADGRRR